MPNIVQVEFMPLAMVTKTIKKLLTGIKKSAEQGIIDAQFTLGMMYHRGHGTAQNDEMAEIWLKKLLIMDIKMSYPFLKMISNMSCPEID